jgi:3-methyladenine DNA glycosylase AlkD
MATPTRALQSSDTNAQLREVLAFFKRRGSKKNVDGMARYAIVAKHVYGVSVGDLRDLAKKLGKNHDLAAALWKTEVYEARMLAAFVEEKHKVTPAQMDRWAKVFDNWAICDHCCFHLFDKTPHAWAKIEAWTKRPEEFVKRAGFALIASVALHDKKAPDAPFLKALKMIERESKDERNFVKKGVNWALRGIGRRNPALKAAAMTLSTRLAGSTDKTARWIGKDALRDLSR